MVTKSCENHQYKALYVEYAVGTIADVVQNLSYSSNAMIPYRSPHNLQTNPECKHETAALKLAACKT